MLAVPLCPYIPMSQALGISFYLQRLVCCFAHDPSIMHKSLRLVTHTIWTERRPASSPSSPQTPEASLVNHLHPSSTYLSLDARLIQNHRIRGEGRALGDPCVYHPLLPRLRLTAKYVKPVPGTIFQEKYLVPGFIALRIPLEVVCGEAVISLKPENSEHSTGRPLLSGCSPLPF
jgi:hypothetical protein